MVFIIRMHKKFNLTVEHHYYVSNDLKFTTNGIYCINYSACTNISNFYSFVESFFNEVFGCFFFPKLYLYLVTVVIS